MEELKEGNIVYHKSTLKKGKIWSKVEGPVDQWIVEWEDNEITAHAKNELLTEEEHKEINS